jgi:hypothetical protein
MVWRPRTEPERRLRKSSMPPQSMISKKVCVFMFMIQIVPLGIVSCYSWYMYEYRYRKCILGAGQDVGRSCIIMSIGGKTIMFDCGMHMAYNDERRFPDFSYISSSGNDFNGVVDCVLITHL